jgi:hypothetical protein
VHGGRGGSGGGSRRREGESRRGFFSVIESGGESGRERVEDGDVAVVRLNVKSIAVYGRERLT